MVTFLLGFTLLALIITAMSVGVLMGRKPIAGSCGGVGAALGEKDYECDICGGDPNKCESSPGANQEKQPSSSQMVEDSGLAYDASQQNKQQ